MVFITRAISSFFQAVGDVGAAFVDFGDGGGGDGLGWSSQAAVPLVATISKPMVDEVLGMAEARAGVLSMSLIAQEDAAGVRAAEGSGAHLRLEEGQREGAVPAHHLACRAHFRAEDGVDAGEAGEGEDGLFDAENHGVIGFGESVIGSARGRTVSGPTPCA